MPYYSVRSGRRPGIYTNYDDVKEQVSGFSNAIFKKFDDRQEAYNFLMLKILPGNSENVTPSTATEQAPSSLDKDANSSNKTNTTTNLKPNLKRKLVEESANPPLSLASSHEATSNPSTTNITVDEGGLKITIQNKNYDPCVFLKTKKLTIPPPDVKPIKAKKLKQTTEEQVEVAKRPTRARPLLNTTAAVTNSANTDRTVVVSNLNPSTSNPTRSNPKPVQIVQPVQSSNSASKSRSPSKSSRQSPNKTANTASESRTMYLTEYEDGLVENFSFNGKSVQVYTDGACSFNGQPKAAAGIGVYWGENHPLNISKRLKGPQTNIRAELNAGIVAISQALTYNASDLTIITDSQFMIDVVTKYIKNWKTNGWMLANKTPVKNINDVKKLDELSQKINVTWKYIQAHKGHDGNTQADLLATSALKS